MNPATTTVVISASDGGYQTYPPETQIAILILIAVVLVAVIIIPILFDGRK